VELQRQVKAMVDQTRERSGWPVRRTLQTLEVSPATYYRWCRARFPGTDVPRTSVGSIYEVLGSERQAVIGYALKHPDVRHRELAWRMLDEGVCGVSSSSVYRVLREARLVCRWQPRGRIKGQGRGDSPTRPDELWQTDIRYVKAGERNYYLLSFLDVYSRYVVYHELLRSMDGWSVSTAAATALAGLPKDKRPRIQSDHGSGFVAREFAETLAEMGVGHTLIRPHTPTDNAEIERYQRTVGEKIDEHDLEDFHQAKAVVAEILNEYNHRRLHSSLSFLRPVDYYRGSPEALLAERRRKLQVARELRKQENLKLRQRLIPWPRPETVSYEKQPAVSL
jgi:putative transposase